MKRLIQRQYSEFRPRICPRKLEATFDRFRTAVREERSVETRNLAEFLCQPALIFVIDQVGNVNRSLDLLPENLFDPRMVVSERIHGDAGEEIQISFVLFVDEVGSASAICQQLIPAVGSKEIFLFQFFYVRQLHKAESLA